MWSGTCGPTMLAGWFGPSHGQGVSRKKGDRPPGNYNRNQDMDNVIAKFPAAAPAAAAPAAAAPAAPPDFTGGGARSGGGGGARSAGITLDDLHSISTLDDQRRHA